MLEWDPVDEIEQFTLRIDSNILSRIKRIARNKAYQEDRDVSATDVMRDILFRSVGRDNTIPSGAHWEYSGDPRQRVIDICCILGVNYRKLKHCGL